MLQCGSWRFGLSRNESTAAAPGHAADQDIDATSSARLDALNIQNPPIKFIEMTPRGNPDKPCEGTTRPSFRAIFQRPSRPPVFHSDHHFIRANGQTLRHSRFEQIFHLPIHFLSSSGQEIRCHCRAALQNNSGSAQDFRRTAAHTAAQRRRTGRSRACARAAFLHRHRTQSTQMNDAPTADTIVFANRMAARRGNRARVTVARFAC
ncbi:hypothetical protein [Burkholderia stagnalis]|uniref:hypothetical protein n=1 Tax=Burkholderia stagnalis TaxID=1503054 RepID=UPI000F815E68|nr:hypothetical protein [Burkholderia stagnalis]